MAVDKVTKDIQDKRREVVAKLRTLGMTVREIEDAIGRQPYSLLNPETQKPWSRAVIFKDMKWLRRQWQKDAQSDTTEHIGRLLAELNELRRRGWQGNANGPIYSLVIAANDREVKLRGLVADKVELTGKGGGPLQHQEIKSMSDEQLAQLAFGAVAKQEPSGERQADAAGDHEPTRLPPDGHGGDAAGEPAPERLDGTPSAGG